MATISGTFQIMFEMSPLCFFDPLTVRLIAPLVGCPTVCTRCSGPQRRGKIERFTALPRRRFFAHFALLVTPREFDADGITQNVIVCACHIDIPAIAPDSGDELNLELKICGVRWIWHGRAILNNRVGRLLKEKRRLALVGFLHFPDVVDIIAPNAIHAPDRKKRV